MNAKECFECSFDTLGIVTVDTSSWDYCPECGSHLVSGDFDRESASQPQKNRQDQQVTEVPIGSEPDGEKDLETSDNVKNENSEDKSGIEIQDAREPDDAPDSFQMTSLNNSEEDEQVEKELDQLRDKYQDDDQDC